MCFYTRSVKISFFIGPGSERLIINHQAAGSIPDTSTFLKRYYRTGTGSIQPPEEHWVFNQLRNN